MSSHAARILALQQRQRLKLLANECATALSSEDFSLLLWALSHCYLHLALPEAPA